MRNFPRATKLCTADEAVALIRSQSTLAVGGFIGAVHPEALTAALERRFRATDGPRGLTLLFAAGQGDGRTRGLNHLAHAGLLRRVIGGHLGLAPGLGRLIRENQIEGYNLPQGVLCQLFRQIAAGSPGVLTHVGLETFIDPWHQGGRLNDISRATLVERLELDGRPWLLYKALPIDCVLLRATAADPWGNLVMDREAIVGEVLALAQAARNSGGLVLAQVQELRDAPACPQHVRVPGALVDRIVVAPPHEHEQTFAEAYNPLYCTGALHTPPPANALTDVVRRIIAARACDELQPGDVANLGIGMPEGVAQIAAERGLLEDVTLTVESGPLGGLPAAGLSFGAAIHPQAIVDQPAQFDFYDGRGLDYAALGAAEIAATGDVNVALFGQKLAGVGGFVNISQTARRLVFCSTFTAEGLQAIVRDGRLEIVREGRVRKFVARVGLVCFAARRSLEIGQRVLYVTERAVFELTPQGLALREVAPGIDLQRQVLDLLPFTPRVAEVRPMAPHLFQPPSG